MIVIEKNVGGGIFDRRCRLLRAAVEGPPHSFTLYSCLLSVSSTCYSKYTWIWAHQVVAYTFTTIDDCVRSPTLGNSFLLERVLQLVNKNYGLLKGVTNGIYREGKKRAHFLPTFFTLCFFTIIVGPCLSLVLYNFVFVLCAKFERRHL